MSTQIEKDEETKRRLSATMTDSVASAVEPRRPSPPRAEMLIKPSTSSLEPKTPPRLTSPASIASTDKGTPQVKQDEEIKRRVSATMGPIGALNTGTAKPMTPTMLIVPASPRASPTTSSPRNTSNAAPPTPNSDKKPSPRQSPYSTSIVGPSRNSLVVPPSPSTATTAFNMSSQDPFAVNFPKARTPSTPSRSSPPRFPKFSTPTSRNREEEERRRVSLPLMPIMPPCSGGEQATPPRRLLGDRKNRVSLPTNASLAATAAAVASASSTPDSHHRRLGEKKQQRISLPPSAITTTTTTTAAAAAASNTNLTPVKHRLGDRKHRVSLPTNVATAAAAAAAISGNNNAAATQQPLPLHSNNIGTATKPPPTPLTPVTHRRLGGKKHERLSLPTSAAALAATAAAAAAVAEQGENQEEATNGEWPAPQTTAAPKRPSTCADSGLPRKGLRQNAGVSAPQQGSSSVVAPILAGPGAFFVSGEGVVVESENDNDNDAMTGEDVEIYVSAEDDANEEETIVVPAKDTDVDIEVGMASQPTLDTSTSYHDHSAAFTVSSRASYRGSPARSRYRSSVVDDDTDHDDSKAKSGCCSFNAPWWCNIFVPLILAGFIITIVTVNVRGISHDGDVQETEKSASPALTPAPTPAADIFLNETVPDFTLQAWEDPKSAQSKAKAWLQDDPYIADYSSTRKFQRFALATLYYASNGARWKNSTNWLSYEHHECLWWSARDIPSQTSDLTLISKQVSKRTEDKAITCNSDLEFAFLLLSEDSLLGSLPPEIALLTALKEISLEGNRLYGPIPSQISALTKLTSLGLSQNGFEGSLPSELGKLSDNLKHFYVRTNKLTGTLPTQLAQLTQLRDIHLTDNQFSSTIPTYLGKLAQLESLRLGGNTFSSTIPSELSNCQDLNLLNFASNRLTGMLPTEIGLLSHLYFLGVANNGLSSTIPTELARLTELQTLFATSAGLRGSIPSQIGQMSSLVALAIGGNRLTQKIPTEIGMMSSLVNLYIYNNNLSGPLPTELGNVSGLSIFQAFLNQISSTLPSEIGRLTDLTQILLFDNTMLSGPIPSGITNLTNLVDLNIKGTAMTGKFPFDTCSLVASQQLSIVADCNKVTCCASGE